MRITLEGNHYPQPRWRRIPKWRLAERVGFYASLAIVILIVIQILSGALPQYHQRRLNGGATSQTRLQQQLPMLARRVESNIVDGSTFGADRKKQHVMVLMGTRPEAIKLAPVILELKARPERFHCTVVSTGQHHAMLVQVLESFGMGSGMIDLSLDLMTKNQSLPALTARVMTSMDAVFHHLRPDLVLVQGDTTTAFVGALAAFYHQIPVGHVEAGLRTYDRYSPFPEEVNRQGIGILASLHFAATALAADHLVDREGKDPRTVFVTGNPVVDALRRYAPGMVDDASPALATVREVLAGCCGGGQRCRLVLLTAHRRENHGQPLRNVLAAVSEVLTNHPDVLVVYPVHLNPNVREAIAASVPAAVYRQLVGDTSGKGAASSSSSLSSSSSSSSSSLSSEADGEESALSSRLLLLPPLDYPALVGLMNMSQIILTDSGGIQEEGAVLGKPIVVLRDTTERPEGVRAGVARLVGTATADVVAEVERLLSPGEGEYARSSSSTVAADLYGDGHAAERIVDLVDWYLHRDAVGPASPPVPSYASKETLYDLVVVLTVWKRATLNAYLEMLSKQTLLRRRPGFRTNVLIFQNGRHLDVAPILDDWRLHATDRWGAAADVTLTHVQSPVATGYYGRFLAPLLSKVRDDGYFVVCDDDVVFGARFLENMARVVDGGSLAVRVGRFIGDPVPGGSGALVEHMGVSAQGWAKGVQVTFDEDVIYDFGGQIWAGKFDWLRTLWSHPPPVWVTSEDFWISAVLQTQLGVGTKRPRCPADDVEQCACSMEMANDHRPVEVGAHSGGEFDVRLQAMGDIAREYAYQRLEFAYKELEAETYTFHPVGKGPFPVEGTWVEQCLYFS